ncbi:MAG: signal peptidase II [Erysipelotrichaceae bacterium]|nr:signal peptidase II [Erysipelotrichaceae bacterium]
MEWAIMIAVLVLDQISKYWIQMNTVLHAHIEIIKDFFYIDYVRNTGAAWSLFSGKVPFLTVVSIVEMIVIAVILVRMHRRHETAYCVSLSLMLGGAAGNLIDRVILGYVRDFLHFYPLGYSFPVFNIADCGITIGMFIVIILMFLEERKDKETA